MIGYLQTRVRKQPIIALILSLRMNSSFITSRPGLEIIRFFFMLNSFEREIYPTHNVNVPTTVGILKFISMINTTFEF